MRIEGVRKRNRKVVLVGDSPLLCNKFGLSARETMIQDAITGGTRRANNQPRDLEREYDEALYRLSATEYGFPCSGIRNCMIEACRGISLSMTDAGQMWWVLPQGWDTQAGDALVRLLGGEDDPQQYNTFPPKPKKGSGRSLVVTGRFEQWCILAEIRYMLDQIDEESILNLLERAGSTVGIGYHRLQNGGSFGAFHVAGDEERIALGLADWR